MRHSGQSITIIDMVKNRTDRLRPLSRIQTATGTGMDSALASRSDGDRRAFDLVMAAQRHYANMEQYRRDRRRNKRYTYGEQWKDVVTVDGKSMTEEEYIYSQGNVPLKNNLIRRLVRNVLGVYRSQSKEPTCTARDRDEQQLGETMSTVLQYNMQLNRMNEVYPRTLEEFLIGGLVVHNKTYGWRDGRLDCWTRIVSPDMFFMDAYSRDVRGWDVSFIGEIHDVSFTALAGEFARSPADYRRLAGIYSAAHARNREYVAETCREFGRPDPSVTDFLIPADHSRCRVIEVWRKESKPRYRCHDPNTGEVFKTDTEDYGAMVESVNRDRLSKGMAMGMTEEEIPLIQAEWFMDEYWYYYFLSPFGDILQEGESPYSHGSHPYVFKAYPFLDGEIHSFVADIIDQQRYTNRLITMYDWIMRASAKGVLLFPEECLPKGFDLKDIADEWSRFNGVIAIKAKDLPPGAMPHQIANNATNIGISELLNLQLKFFEDISGVNGALQGKPGYSGMSAALYSQQTQNSTTSLLDILDSFSSFVIDAAYKDVKNIQQYYDAKKIFNIAGKAGETAIREPGRVRDVEFDLSIIESTTTPTFRAMANEFLMEIWKTGQINLEQLLEHGDFPFADKLLQSIRSQRQQMAQGQTPEGVSPELLQQARQGADMDSVEKAYGMLK